MCAAMISCRRDHATMPNNSKRDDRHLRQSVRVEDRILPNWKIGRQFRVEQKGTEKNFARSDACKYKEAPPV